MITLALDTSTNRGSVTVLDDDRIVLDEIFTADRSHTSALFPILEKARALAPRVDVIAIGLGPGSYAGVRIAIAAALGMSMSNGAQLVGIASVAALETDARRYIAIGDARRETFYFTRVENGACIEGPLLLAEDALRARLAELESWPVLSPEVLALFPQVKVALPLSLTLARLAAEGRGIIARENLEPLYLREPHITLPRLVPRHSSEQP